MSRLDHQYREATGLVERRFYSIFYSQVDPSPLLIIGFNPGGDPDSWDESALASRSFYENGEHEYVDCHYPIAVAMREFLLKIGSINSEDLLRRIPKTNLIFRRSRSMDGLRLSERDAILEAKPMLDQIIERVVPRVVICEGVSTLQHFEKHYCESIEEEIDGVSVSTPNGQHKARIYKADKAVLSSIQQPVTILGIGHPSKYSGRLEWSQVIASAKKLLAAAPSVY